MCTNYFPKKFLCVLLVVSMVFSLVACADSKVSETKQNELTVWAWDTAVTAAEQAAVRYMESHMNVSINVVNMSQDDVVSKLNIALSAGDISILPDIVFVEDYNLFGYIKNYPNMFADLTNEIEKELFMRFKLDSMLYNEALYGVPYDSGATVLFYRKDILETAGFQANDLDNLTWNRYIEIGRVVKEKTGKDMLPIYPAANMEGRIMLQSGGSWYVKDDGITLNINGNLVLGDVISTIDKLYQSGIVYDCATWDDMVSSIYNSKVASVVGACWWGPIISDEKGQNGLWRIARIPRMEGNDQYTNYSNLGGSSWCVINNDDKALSIDFLKRTFVSDTDLINQLAKDVGLVTVVKAAVNVPNYDIPDPTFGDQLAYKEIVSWGDSIPSVNYGSITYEIDEIVGNSIADVVRNGLSINNALKKIEHDASLIVQ